MKFLGNFTFLEWLKNLDSYGLWSIEQNKKSKELLTKAIENENSKK